MLPDEVKVGDYIYMKKNPCKITDISSGSLFHFNGVNIFTNKKHECMYTKKHTLSLVESHKFKLLKIREDDAIDIEYDSSTGEIIEDVETYGVTDELRTGFIENKTYITMLITDKNEKYIVSYEIVDDSGGSG